MRAALSTWKCLSFDITQKNEERVQRKEMEGVILKQKREITKLKKDLQNKNLEMIHMQSKKTDILKEPIPSGEKVKRVTIDAVSPPKKKKQQRKKKGGKNKKDQGILDETSEEEGGRDPILEPKPQEKDDITDLLEEENTPSKPAAKRQRSRASRAKARSNKKGK